MRSCGSSVPVEQTAEQVTVHLGGWSSAMIPEREDRGAGVSYDGWWAGGMAEEVGDPMGGGP